MAVIPAIPAQEVIATLKGHVDFYLHKGRPTARLWPTWKLKQRSPAVQVFIDLFKEAMGLWSTLPPEIQEAYTNQAQGSGLTGRDLWVRAYIKGLAY